MRAPESASDILRLRAGDEVIVRAEELYEGKIVASLGEGTR